MSNITPCGQCFMCEWKCTRSALNQRKFQKNSGGACPQTPLDCCVLMHTARWGFAPPHIPFAQFCPTQIEFLNEALLTDKSVCQADSIYLYFRKEFDRVPHLELLSKLESIGICGRLLSWFCCYLSNRKQLVSINGSHSSVLPVSSGVPQGSILGLLLFLVYINDLPDTITSCKVFLFADDTKCCQPISAVSYCEQLQNCLHKLSGWSKRWNLHFNESKCVIMNFQKPTKSITISNDYTVGRNAISVSDCHRDLGVLLQSNLNRSNQYNLMCSKAYKVLNLVRRSFSSSNSVVTRRSLYISLVRSQKSYCSQFWRPLLIKDIKKLESVQRRATKTIGSEQKGINYKERLIHLNLLPLICCTMNCPTSCSQ